MTVQSAETATATGTAAPDPAGAKSPSRLMTDMARAMQTAVLSARAATMDQFTADAKTATEQVNARASDEASELRQRAEDDVAAIRDWSKAEMARIREETEGRIGARRSLLDRELEAHTGRVEKRLEQLADRVKAYEARMERYFEALMAEENPARIAAMAEQMPEPPPFDDLDQPMAEHPPEPAVPATAETPGPTTAASAVVETDNTLSAWGDPRLAALGLDPDGSTPSDDAAPDEAVGDVPEMDEETLAARLAGILPAEEAADGAPADEPQASQVKVVGLVSVAAIAGFKRSLGRVEGVSSVGVSSGPDGHFLFSVTHLPSVSLRDVIPTFPGFEARVTASGDGVIEVTARDPEAGS
jgi:hypothetical protein